MATELEKMLAGELYDPLDPELVRARERARDLCWDLNASRDAVFSPIPGSRDNSFTSRVIAGGSPSCSDSQLQNSAASSQLTCVTGWLSRSIDWRSM